MIGIAIWWGIAASSDMSFDVAQFHVVNDRRVDLTFIVTNQDGKPVTCTIEAQNSNHNRVGVMTVDLPASQYTTTEYSRTIPTVSKSVTAIVDSCSYR